LSLTISERIAIGKHRYEAWARLLQAILQDLVSDPNELWLEIDYRDRPPTFAIHCAPMDVARVIGRYNRGVEALAILTKTWSFRYDLPARIEVLGARKWGAEPSPRYAQRYGPHSNSIGGSRDDD
jgi:predicted RNA-binding protein YlqC (UPF0109 family)